MYIIKDDSIAAQRISIAPRRMTSTGRFVAWAFGLQAACIAFGFGMAEGAPVLAAYLRAIISKI